ncbi:transposase [Streptomyces wedmorensis]
MIWRVPQSDHVCLLVQNRRCHPAPAVGSLKHVSARRLRQEFPTNIRNYPRGARLWYPLAATQLRPGRARSTPVSTTSHLGLARRLSVSRTTSTVMA